MKINFSGGTSTPCGSVSTAAGIFNCGSATNVNILTTADTGILASCLISVNGNLNVDGNTNGLSNNVLKTVSFPLLAFTVGFLQVWNGASGSNNAVLTLIDLHSLTYVGNDFDVETNSALTSFSLPVLAFVGGYVGVYYNPALVSLTFPALTSVGRYVYVFSNSNLATLALPALAKINNKDGNSYSVYLCNNAASSFSYSAAISRAAAGQKCYVPPSFCTSPTTCT